MENLYQDGLAGCVIDGTNYPSGYFRCSEGKCHRCYDGKWIEEDAPHVSEKDHIVD